VTDSTDAHRSSSRELSLTVECVSKADESMEDNTDFPEKVDQAGDSSRDSTGLQVLSYDQVHQKFGLILCDLATDNLKHMPHEAHLWMRVRQDESGGYGCIPHWFH
jgi:hypothetical protein